MNLVDLIANENFNFSQPSLVMGSAPSVKNAKKISNSITKIAVGDLPWRAPEIGKFSYWVTANNIFPIPWNENHYNIIRKVNIPTLISCVALSESSYVKSINRDKLKMLEKMMSLPNIIPYDSVHSAFNSSRCSFKEDLKVGPSIQDLIATLNLFNSTSYSSGHTVAIHGFALAVLLRSNPIYLCGIEIPQTMNKYKYINNLKRLNYSDETYSQYTKRLLKNYSSYIGRKFNTDFAYKTFDKIIEDFTNLSKIANTLGIEVINLSPKSSLTKVRGIITVE